MLRNGRFEICHEGRIVSLTDLKALAVCELYSDLSADAKERFSINFHEIPISASAFLLDHERESGGRTFVDFKLYSFSHPTVSE